MSRTGITVTQADVGRKVVYRPYRGAKLEEGVVSSVPNHKSAAGWCFVRYGSDLGAKLTRLVDLEWVAP